MFRTTVGNLTQKRTIRPLFAQTQATPYPGFLDPNWTRATDIYPGVVMTKLAKETFTVATTDTTKPWGLSALFVAPALGIDEVKASGTNNFTVWKGDSQATFEVLAPAFAADGDWALPTDGSRKLLTYTNASHAQGPGRLTTVGATNANTALVAELVDVIGTNKIVVNLNRFA